MSASITDFVIIPAVVVASLVVWLVMVYWADSHPQHPARTPREAPMTRLASQPGQHLAVSAPTPKAQANRVSGSGKRC